MKRAVAILSITLIGLFVFDWWSFLFISEHHQARAFVLSPAFTAFLLIGGAFAICVCTALVAALLVYPEPPSGRTEPEDHP